jgi:hypothetical protein
VKFLLACLILTWLAPDAALAQPGRHGGPGQRTSNMSPDQRRQLRQDVDSARGDYQRRSAPRQGSLPPQEREQLRRDVQDANRDLRRR